MFGNELTVVYLRLMAIGLLYTIVIAVVVLALGTILGVALGVLRTVGPKSLRVTIAAYVHLVRSIPLLILLFISYYGIPLLVGLDPSALQVAFFALSIHLSAYMVEIVRSSLQATPRGQWEAAASLGLTTTQAIRKVISPQAWRIAIPSIVSLFIGNIKDSSLASILGVAEATQAALSVRSLTLSNWDIMALLLLEYVALNSIVSTVGARLERRACARVGGRDSAAAEPALKSARAEF